MGSKGTSNIKRFNNTIFKFHTQNVVQRLTSYRDMFPQIPLLSLNNRILIKERNVDLASDLSV